MADRPFLTATWQHLILANFECDSKIVEPYLPKGTALDLWKGKCLISLVGFQFFDTRLKGIKVPFHSNFEEVNLRFYVTHEHNGEIRRGVVFIKEIVPKAAITFVANTVYKEHYITCPMSNTVEEVADSLHATYRWKYNGESYAMSAEAETTAIPLAAESEAEFIAEHYWGYTAKNPETTSQYEVRHPQWDNYPVKHYAHEGNMHLLYGDAFGDALAKPPHSVFLAKGSSISVHPAQNID